MKQLLTIIVFFVSIGSFAQRNVPGNVRDLDIALVERDTAFLKDVLHDELSYGHSNGWVETKADLLEHLFNGKLTYKSIESTLLTMDHADKVTIVRTESNIKYVLDGKEGELKLHVMQVWVINKKGWQLLSRQSTKVN
jgi:hypothetical protein